jgi:hypothetical protein
MVARISFCQRGDRIESSSRLGIPSLSLKVAETLRMTREIPEFEEGRVAGHEFLGRPPNVD